MNLFGMESIDELDKEEIARKSLENLMSSYGDEADVFTEIIQNACDAIRLACDEGLLSENEAELTIILGRRKELPDYLFVAENGVGMSPQVAKQLTVPGYSYLKKKGKTVGYKGVGASYFFGASRKVSLLTISKDSEKTEYSISGSYDWVTSPESDRPSIKDKFSAPETALAYLPETRGTAIYFQFHDGISPNNLSGLVKIGNGPEEEIGNWMSYLASKTSLGVIEARDSIPIKVNFVLDHGDAFYEEQWQLGDYDRENKKIGYPYPHKVVKRAQDVEGILRVPDHERYKHDRRHQAVYKRWSSEEIIEQTNTLTEKEIDALRNYLEWVEGYFCYSTEVLKEVNSRLGGRSNLIRHGTKIACDNSPQGRNISLSLTSSQGLDRQTHIVMSFNGLPLDMGRKISADEAIESAIDKLGQRVVGVLKEFRWAMKKKERPEITTDLNQWIEKIENRSQTSLVRSLFNDLELENVFFVDPDNESEVIALFVSLLANKIIDGYQLRAISGYARYDAVVDVETKRDSLCDKQDILSIRQHGRFKPGDNKVLEFKYSFEDLLLDFDEKKKNPAEIDLLVCWSVPGVNVSRGRLETAYGDWRDHREIYGQSYMWVDENETSFIPVIALQNLCAEKLSNIESTNGSSGIGSVIFKELISRDRDGII